MEGEFTPKKVQAMNEFDSGGRIWGNAAERGKGHSPET